MSWTNDLDPHFAQAWADYTGGLATRQMLSERVRLLVGIGECTMIGEADAVIKLTEQALQAQVPIAEIHEVLLQGCIYAGRPVVQRTLDAFADFVSRAGLRDELGGARIPATGRNAERSLERERAAWPAKHHYKRIDDMLAKYDWRGISTRRRRTTTPGSPSRTARRGSSGRSAAPTANGPCPGTGGTERPLPGPRR